MLGEAFAERRPSTRGRFDAVGVVRLFFKKNLFPECNTRGKNLSFFIKILIPECCTRGRNSIFFKKNSSSPSAPSQALGEEYSPFLEKTTLPRVPLLRHSGKFFFAFACDKININIKKPTSLICCHST
jgi:hypothetical protein